MSDYRPAISEHDCLAKTIRFLATGETQRNVAFNFLAGRSTVSSILSEVSEALWLVLRPLYLRHPSTTDEWMKISQEFHERFIYVEFGHSGSESDGGIFSRFNLEKNILQGALGLPPVSTMGNEGPLPYFFVGDEAFPLKEYVMRPYARRIGTRELERPLYLECPLDLERQLGLPRERDRPHGGCSCWLTSGGGPAAARALSRSAAACNGWYRWEVSSTICEVHVVDILFL
ncbi:hypothetical protein MRX96_014423 [Rhipicephalus microplus]